MNKILLLIFTSFLFSDVFEGYTLYTTDSPYTTYLIDNEENIINEWDTDCQPASMGYLQPDSTLIYPCKQDDLVLQGVAASGGRILKYDWDGNVLWDWSCEGQYQLHHDIEPTPEGTILVIAIEEIEEGIRPDVILEIEPYGLNDALFVWSWEVWEHRGSNSPYLFDEDVPYNKDDWNHFNSIHLNEDNNIILSSRTWNEFYIIERGGNSDILYRWGNPQNYGRGTAEDQVLFANHGVNQIPTGYPGEGNIIIFNNKPNETYSSILEIAPPINYWGQYMIFGSDPFGPFESVWEYENEFHSPKQSGVFRLPNGNTFISVADGGQLLEVNPEGDIVWEFQQEGILRAQKYGLDYLTILGDVNNDGEINVLDVVIIVGYILENSYIIIADINEDGILNVLDIVILTTVIFEGV